LSYQESTEVPKFINSSTESAGAEPVADRSVLLSGVSIVSGIIQGACAILVASSSLKILVGLAGLAAAMKSSEIHSEPVRLPLMAISTVFAVVTLFVLWNGHRLRNLSSARWRKRELNPRAKLAIGFSMASALITLILVAAELYIHPIFGHHGR
jgi:hypothetical protein